MAIPSLQDFSLLSTHVKKTTEESDLRKESQGFAILALQEILYIGFDEADNSMTDSEYLSTKPDAESGFDRGIDAIYIDQQLSSCDIHIFNFKYTSKYERSKSNFPSAEIDKVSNFVSHLMHQDELMIKSVNPVLAEKIKDIWKVYSTYNQSTPKIKIHLCSNHILGLVDDELNRFKRELKIYDGLEIYEYGLGYFSKHLTNKGRSKIDCSFRAIDRNYFEKSDGDVRALIVNVEALDLIRMVNEDEDVRKDVDLADNSRIISGDILEDAFEDNVRVYLKQRTKINRNIKETALSKDNHRFFYFNNGITITCKGYTYSPVRRAPVISLEDFQIVNGSQTIHALSDALKANNDCLDNINLLCRIYETKNEQLSTAISEYTNSQNPVKSRDIRANDYTQKVLEKELAAFDYLYERKKGQVHGYRKSQVIDAEKAGQAIMAFFLGMPAEAKDQKRLIFSEKYEDVFSDNRTASQVILAYEVFSKVEDEKKRWRAEAVKGKYDDVEFFVTHASYYLLYVISELCEKERVPKEHQSTEFCCELYSTALDLIKKAVREEMSLAEEKGDKYSHRTFFIGNKPKQYIRKYLYAE